MKWVFPFLLLSFHIAASGSNWTQIDFDRAVNSHYHSCIQQMLKENDALLINPSANSNEALMIAAVDGDAKTMELLLKDPRVDPTDRDDLALQRAVQFLRLEVVLLLLRDGRSSVGYIYEVPEISFVLEIRGIPRTLMEASWTGDLEMISNDDVQRIDLLHIDLLLERARNHPEIRNLLYRRQLELLGAPWNVVHNKMMPWALAEINPGHPTLTKGLFQAYSRLALLFSDDFGSKHLRKLVLPHEILLKIAGMISADVVEEKNIVPLEQVNALTRFGRASYPVPYVVLYMLADFLNGERISMVPEALLLLYSLVYAWYYLQPIHPYRTVKDKILDIPVAFCIGCLVARLFIFLLHH